MRKKLLCLAALITALGILISGCGGGDKSTSAVKLSNDGSKITEEPTELTIFCIRSDSEKTEDLDVWKEIAKKTNVSLKTTNATSVSDANQMINTMLASGELPDLIIYSNIKEFAQRYGVEGAFAKIDEIISDETPNLKKQFDRPEVKTFVTATDDHIYYVPKILPGSIPASGWFVRQDWLDKLSLSQPTNIDEYYEVLKAFRDRDPNGNGKNDEVPYFCRFSNVDALLEMQNIRAGWGVKDGKVYYSPASDEYKDGMSLIVKWYSENLIDKEIYTRGGKSREKLFGDNVGGSTHDYFGTTAQFNDLLKDSVPGFNVVAIAPPGGKEYTLRATVHTGGAAISAASDKKEVAIRFLDYLYSEEGSRYMNFGIESKQYDMKDGKPYYNDSILHGSDTAINELAKVGSCSDFPFIQDFWYEEQWLTDEAKRGMDMYKSGDYIIEPFPTLSYTSEEKDRYTELYTSISTYVSEHKQKWVLGSEDIESSFASYQQEIKKLGLDEMVKIQQAAYDRYIKSIKDSK